MENTTRKLDIEVFNEINYQNWFNVFLKQEEVNYKLFYNDLTKRGLNNSKIQDETIKLFQKLREDIFSLVEFEGETLIFRDQFLDLLISEFYKFLNLNEPNPINLLFSQIDIIIDKTINHKMWDKGDLIHLSNEKKIQFLAKYHFLKTKNDEFNKIELFEQWQKSNILETRSIVSPHKIELFHEYENKLFQMNYLTYEGRWNTEKAYLIVFIIKLTPKLESDKLLGRGRNKKSKIRQFFEKRYLINLVQESMPSRIAKLNQNHKKSFDFIQ